MSNGQVAEAEDEEAEALDEVALVPVAPLGHLPGREAAKGEEAEDPDHQQQEAEGQPHIIKTTSTLQDNRILSRLCDIYIYV